MPDPAVNIVGVGNVLMGDDGVGVAAVEALARRALPEGVRLHDAGLAVGDVLGRLDPSDPLIVLDAVRGGGPPGSLYRLRPGAPAPGGRAAAGAVSLHELNVTAALQLEALSGRVFVDVMVFGVEPDVIAWGEGLSPAASGAMDRLVGAVLRYVESRSAERRGRGVCGPTESAKLIARKRGEPLR